MIRRATTDARPAIPAAFITVMPILIALLLHCGNSGIKASTTMNGYDLNRPDQVLLLPAILHEISGLTWIDSASFACIQDEDGILFIYDLAANIIREQYSFNKPGDYEGITRVGDIFYVLRSDGVLFEITDYQNGNPKVAIYPTAIPAKDNEGLCYDQKNGRLLLACKSKFDKSIIGKNKRAIYGFDLKSKTLSSRPVIEPDLAEIEQSTRQPALKLKISDLGISPITGKLFVLSAAEYLLYIFDQNGTIEHIEKLNPLLFNKAEGITFLQNGDLLISNEGQKGKPTVLRFNYHKSK